jgi:glycosyltransferase involved in cell wall biosynthesis
LINTNISIVIPCYKEKAHVLDVLKRIPEYVNYVYCVDDGCPDGTGQHIQANNNDSRVKVIYQDKNQGVGAAMIAGYKAAIDDNSEIIVKIDGDGQMDPELIPKFINPILNGYADYTKGNRFFDAEKISTMPKIRILGNAILSFMNKISTGYWRLFDPNNGYTAIHSNVLNLLPLKKIHNGYFFESDMLFRLNIIRAVVTDIPMSSSYGNEDSHLKVEKALFTFSMNHIKNFLKRIIYNYFIRDFSMASLELVLGPSMILFGITFGSLKWMESIQIAEEATAGTVMLAALPVIIGLQLTLSALSFDIDNAPSRPLHPLLD